MSKNVVYPTLIINGLNDLRYKNQILSYVKIVRNDIFKRWINNLNKEK